MKPEVEAKLVEMAKLYKLVGPQASNEKALDVLADAMNWGWIVPPGYNKWGIEYRCGPQQVWNDGDWHAHLRAARERATR